jgi:carbon-monoxide dehydrogenase small subunit
MEEKKSMSDTDRRLSEKDDMAEGLPPGSSNIEMRLLDTVKLLVNGKEHILEVGANETLLEILRERLRLTGSKIGCNRGECGACTVLIDGESVLSCLTLAIECDGKSILTIEGLEDPDTGDLDPIQEAFVENFGIQCGFCTPGMVMSAKALLDKNSTPSEQEIREGIQGNLCRCTGYQQIVESIQAAGKMRRRT